jgi:hypothetical protein
MKTIIIFAALCGTVTAQDRSIAELRRQIAQGYHQVNPRTQTQARSGDPEAQARLRYQQAQAQATGDYNTGRISASNAAYARQRAAANYQAEIDRQQQLRQHEQQLRIMREQTEQLRRFAEALERENAKSHRR